MEVLVVIALLGLVTAVVATDFGASIDGARTPSPYETLVRALNEGRDGVLESGVPAVLTFDAEAGALRVVVDGVATTHALPPGCVVRFALPADMAEGEERALDAVTFHPAGCVTPAVVALTVGGRESRYRLETFSATLVPEVRP